MQVKIRQEDTTDYQAVFEVNKFAFGQDNEATLVDSLRNSMAFVPELSLVATFDNEIVGHILFTKIKIVHDDRSETESLALAPMAVKPEFQNKGVGGQLIQAGLHIARQLEYKSVVVLGHKVYYRQFGFDTAKKWGINPPFIVKDEENFMAVELINDGLRGVNGVVQYPPAFNTL